MNRKYKDAIGILLVIGFIVVVIFRIILFMEG